METSEKVIIRTDLQVKQSLECIQAGKILEHIHSMQQIPYISAAFNADKDTVTLAYWEIACPSCEKSHIYHPEIEITENQTEVMRRWADSQLDMLSAHDLTFAEGTPKYSICPHCGLQLKFGQNSDSVTVCRKKSKITVCSEISDLGTILHLPYLSGGTAHFPLYEQLEFNLRTGHISVRGMTASGENLGILDVTNHPLALKSCAIWNRVQRSQRLRKVMLQEYKAYTGITAPFSAQELSLVSFVYITRFIGFSPEFYRAVPFHKETLSVDKSFKGLHRLRNPAAARACLRAYAFAAFPSIRRCIGENQALLFYLPECEMLYRIVKDVNLLRSILKHSGITELLLSLHQSPSILTFFNDYRDEFGAVRLCHMLCCDRFSGYYGSMAYGGHYRWMHYPLYYSSLNSHAQAEERKAWRRAGIFKCLVQNEYNSISLPMLGNLPGPENCVVDGFVFTTMKNTADCYTTGKKLNNCLQNWKNQYTTIISVSLCGKTVAAIEAENGKIVQAYSENNESISVIPRLPEAIKKWAAGRELDFFQEI